MAILQAGSASGLRRNAMASIDKFNDHCWKDVVPGQRPETLRRMAARDFRRSAAGAACHRSLRSRLSRRTVAAGRDQRPLSEYLRCFRSSSRRADQKADRGGAPRRHSRFFSAPRRRGPTTARAARFRRGASGKCRSTAMRFIMSSTVEPEDILISQAACQHFSGHAAVIAPVDSRRAEPDRVRREHLGLRARERRRRLFERISRQRG